MQLQSGLAKRTDAAFGWKDSVRWDVYWCVRKVGGGARWGRPGDGRGEAAGRSMRGERRPLPGAGPAGWTAGRRPLNGRLLLKLLGQLAHLAQDGLVEHLGVVTRHVGVRVAEHLGHALDRDPVGQRVGGEEVAREM